jgi:hypothetical protein
VKRIWERWGPLTGLLSIPCLVVGSLMVLSQPQDSASDSSIVAYFAVHSHRVKGIAGLFVFLAGVLLLVAFLAVLRDRLVAAEGATGGLSALAFGAGLVSAGVATISMLLANGTMLAVTNSSHFRIDPNTYRLLADTAYGAWAASVMVAALVVWAASALALRTGVLPAWWGRLGVVVGIAQLAAFLYFPFFAWLIWILVTSLLLIRRRDVARARAAQPAV